MEIKFKNNLKIRNVVFLITGHIDNIHMTYVYNVYRLLFPLEKGVTLFLF